MVIGGIGTLLITAMIVALSYLGWFDQFTDSGLLSSLDEWLVTVLIGGILLVPFLIVASYPELRGCLTSGETAEAALKNAQDCKREWLAAALEDGYEIPEPMSDDEYSGQFKLRLPKSLHRALAENSKREGISMNQYCLYLLTKNNAEFRHGA